MTTTIEQQKPVIIVGAGIAGLSLAIQLTEKNIPCIVLEGRAYFAGATSGVRISAKGVRVLEEMGIDNIGEETNKLIMYFGKSKLTFDVKNEINASPAIIVTRLAVFEKLRERIQELNIPVVYNFTLDKVIENSDAVVAISSEGKEIHGSYLVGADGVGSKVRSILNPDCNYKKRYAGYLGIGLIFPSDKKVEMSLFNHVNGNIGLGSIGKIKPNDTYTNNFLWLHIHMPESEAKAMTDEEVNKRIAERATRWTLELQDAFNTCCTNSKTILYHQPVYNGSIPEKWYSDRIILIGDAAHPYGPGGQGISLAMLDAKACCELFEHGFTEENKFIFQTERAAIAKKKGESSEERNKPENQQTTAFGLFFKGLLMKGYHFIKGGKITL